VTSIIKEANLSPIKSKKVFDSPVKTHEHIVNNEKNKTLKANENIENSNKTPNDVHKMSNSTLKPTENLENTNKTPSNPTGSRLKKSEKVTHIVPLSNENRPSLEKKTSNNAMTNLNTFLNNIKDFNTDSPGLNKNLLHDKSKKNVSPSVLQLENPEKQKKKNQRLFSISILEKVEELSKMEQVVPKE